jgi:hypothetical protein
MNSRKGHKEVDGDGRTIETEIGVLRNPPPFLKGGEREILGPQIAEKTLGGSIDLYRRLWTVDFAAVSMPDYNRGSLPAYA